MKSWKGQEKGLTATQPGSPDTKLGAGGPTGRGRASSGCGLPAQQHDTKNVDSEYDLPTTTVESLKNFMPVQKGQFLSLEQMKTETPGITEYWHSSTDGMKQPKHG